MIFPLFGNEFYLHLKILYWKVIQLFIHLNKRIYVIIIMDVSLQVVLFLMTSWWIWSVTRQWNSMWKELKVILQILRTTEFICTGGHFNNFTGIKALLKVLMLHVYISMLKESNWDNMYQNIEILYFKWWYEGKYRPLVGYLQNISQKLYYYAFRIIQFFVSWRE